MPAATPSPQANQSLQRLSLTTLELHRISRRGLAVSRLSKIGAVRVTRQRDVDKGVTAYEVSVRAAEAASSRLPTPATNAYRERRLSSFWTAMCASVDVSSDSSRASMVSSSSSLLQPTESVELEEPEMPLATKRLADFAALRDAVYSLAMTSHNFDVCEFCERALLLALWGGAEHFQQQRNALALLILDENKLLETLAALVRDLVEICASSTSGSGRGGRVLCRAEHQLPIVVHAFLFGDSL